MHFLLKLAAIYKLIIDLIEISFKYQSGNNSFIGALLRKCYTIPDVVVRRLGVQHIYHNIQKKISLQNPKKMEYFLLQRNN